MEYVELLLTGLKTTHIITPSFLKSKIKYVLERSQPFFLLYYEKKPSVRERRSRPWPLFFILNCPLVE